MNYTAYLIQPKIIMENKLNFGIVHVKDTVQQKITLYNPSNKPLQVQLFIGPSHLESEQSIKNFFN